MEERKSRRNRKKFDYSKSHQSNNSDDDFVSNEPSSKKSKKKQTKVETKRENNVSLKAQRLIDRENIRLEEDLNRAIQLSISSKENTSHEVDTSKTESESKEKNILTKEKNSLDKKMNSDSPKQSETVCKVEDIIAEDKNINKSNEDKDYVESDVESEEEDDVSDMGVNSDDSEFSLEEIKKPKKSTKNNKTTPKVQKPCSKKEYNTKEIQILTPPSKNKENDIEKHNASLAPKIASKAKVLKSRTNIINNKPKTLVKPIIKIKQPSWNAPGKIGSPSLKPTLNSPSRSLRLGLSRNSRFKPLHPNLSKQTP